MIEKYDTTEVGPVLLKDVGRLTKREMIAAMAMQGILASMPQAEGQIYWAIESVPKASVMLADKLLSELGESNE